MANYRTTRFLSVSLVIIIVAIAVVGLIYVARVLFFSGGNGVVPQTNSSQSGLTSTSADRSVLMKVRGPIVANEDFRSYQILVTPNERTFTVNSGYMDEKIQNLIFSNNTPAYEQFVYALNIARLMNANELTGDRNDTRGVCATGYLYEFQTLKSDKSVKSLWTTSCTNVRGSLIVKVKPLVALFTVQIPNVQPLITSIWP